MAKKAKMLASLPLGLNKPEKQDKPSFDTLPTSPIVSFMGEVMNYGASNLNELASRKKKINRNQVIEIQQSENTANIAIRAKTKNATVIVQLKNIEKHIGNNTAAKKFFNFLLVKANKQIYREDIAHKEIVFPLQELVDKGLYSDIRGARAGFERAIDTLKLITINGKIERTGATAYNATIYGLSPIRYGAIKNGVCSVLLEELLNWDAILQYYSFLPPYYLQLKPRTTTLAETISFFARQKTREIAEQGYFTISLRVLHQRLMLPNEDNVGNRQYKQLIKQPIEEAIAEINEKEQQNHRTMKVELCADPKAPIKQYLDTGYIKVYLYGDLLESFKTQSQKQAQAIEKTQKKRKPKKG